MTSPEHRAACVGLRRSGRCRDADSAHAGSVHGAGSGIQERDGTAESATRAPTRCAACIDAVPYPLQTKCAGHRPALFALGYGSGEPRHIIAANAERGCTLGHAGARNRVALMWLLACLRGTARRAGEKTQALVPYRLRASRLSFDDA